MTKKEKLLAWINVHVPNYFTINSDNYWDYVGDTEEPFVNIQEWIYKEALFSQYLKNPTEETIDEFLKEMEYQYHHGNIVQRRASRKVLNRFKV